MKIKLIQFLAKQIMNLLPGYKTRIMLWIGYVISAYNLLLSPTMIQGIHDAFGYDLSTNKWVGIVGVIMTFLIDLFVQAKDLRHQEEIKIVKSQYKNAA